MFVPTPSGISNVAFHMFIVFLMTMFAMMIEVSTPVVVLIFAISFLCVSKTLDIKDCFSGFSNIVPWFLFTALSLSHAIIKTTIGLRISYKFIKHFGGSIIGLAFSIIFTELLMAPIIPSNTARGASVGYPIVVTVSKYISSNIKGISEKQIGVYLSFLYSISCAICSGLFVTGMISNTIIVDIAANFGINLTWMTWFKFTVLPASIILLISPFFLKFFCKLKAPSLEGLKKQSAENYEKLGKITKQEKIIIWTFVAMLLMWIFSNFINIQIMVTALMGLSVFLLLSVVDVKEILSSYNTLNSILTLGVLISFVNNLVSLGVIDWFSTLVISEVSDVNKTMAFIILSVVYFFSHYFFTGEGSKVIALYSVFVTAGLLFYHNKLDVIMTLAFFSSTSSILTNYASPVSMIMFSSGYVNAKKWLCLGFVFSLIIMGVWFACLFI